MLADIQLLAAELYSIYDVCPRRSFSGKAYIFREPALAGQANG